MISNIGSFEDSNILISGGLGFIGSNLAFTLVEGGANVMIVDSLISSCGGNISNIDGINTKVKIEQTDIRDKDSMDRLVRDQDYIFNLAAQISHTGSMEDPFTDLDINCYGQLVLLEACRKNNPEVRIIYTGTRGQYGSPDYLPVDEKHPMHPTDINGINKLAGEKYHLLYNKAYGVRTTILRLSNTYGPRHQMKHGRQGVINWFIRKAMDDETIKIYGDGKQVRDCNYVEDVVEALLIVASKKKALREAFNIGGTPSSLIDLAKMIIKVVGKGRYEQIPYPEASQIVEVGDYIADYSKINKMLGWSPTTSLEEGLKKTFEFYKENKSKYW